MNKFKRFFMLLFVVMIGFALVGCDKNNDKDDDKDQGKDPEPTLVTPTSLEIQYSIYDELDNKPIVLIGGDEMQLEVIINGEGDLDERVEWTIDKAEKATLTDEGNGSVFIKGLKSGNVVVTVTSKADATIKASETIEIVEATDKTTILLNAKEEMLNGLPLYATADFKLPVPANENVTVIFTDNSHQPFANNTFKYTYTEDSIAVIFMTLKYKTSSMDFTIDKVRLVADAAKNSFIAVENARTKLLEDMAKLTIATDNNTLYKINESLETFYTDPTTSLQALELINSFTAEEVGKETSVTWQNESTADPVLIKGTEGAAYMTYAKPLADTTVGINALIKCEGKTDIIKFKFIAAGWTPDEVWEYFVSKGGAPIEGKTFSSAFFKVATTDTSKKFTKLTVEWSTDEATSAFLDFKPANSSFVKSNTSYKGAAVIIATVYYNKHDEEALVDKLDEEGNVMKDEEGKVIQESIIRDAYDWMKVYEINVTFK